MGERYESASFIHKIPSTAYRCVVRRKPFFGEMRATRTLTHSVCMDNRYEERGIVLGDIVEQVIAESADESSSSTDQS